MFTQVLSAVYRAVTSGHPSATIPLAVNEWYQKVAESVKTVDAAAWLQFAEEKSRDEVHIYFLLVPSRNEHGVTIVVGNRNGRDQNGWPVADYYWSVGSQQLNEPRVAAEDASTRAAPLYQRLLEGYWKAGLGLRFVPRSREWRFTGDT